MPVVILVPEIDIKRALDDIFHFQPWCQLVIAGPERFPVTIVNQDPLFSELAETKEQLVDLIDQAEALAVDWMAFTREMIEAFDDDEIQTVLARTPKNKLEYLGVGLFGEKTVLKNLTREFRLWKYKLY